MEVLVEFETDQKSPLQILEQIKEVLELEVKRKGIKVFTVSIVTGYDQDRLCLEVLHTQGYEEKKETETLG